MTSQTKVELGSVLFLRAIHCPHGNDPSLMFRLARKGRRALMVESQTRSLHPPIRSEV